jgi:transitional endoplasmic reticulum ATPase
MTSNFFKGFEDLLELAKTLEEKIEQGELKADIRVNTRHLTNIPAQGSIPKSPMREPASPDVIITPPPKPTASNPTATPPSATFNLSQVGGLGSVIQELRELVEIPLKRPEILEKLGLEPPRGVLLVGPPGTGKTLTARALAQELGVHYIAITGPEVMGKYYGEAESKLRAIFEKASNAAPCLIFIDEIDSLTPNRQQVEGEVEKRVVGQLLGLMDGFAQMRGVIVLAATNCPNHLDPALRRPGRFDREIVFRVPDRAGRLEILQIQTQSMPLDGSVNLDHLADLCIGFVGADLKALCQKAAYYALRRQVPSLDAVPDSMTVTQADFQEALKVVKPSVLRSVEIESPAVSWDEIGGLEAIKQTLQESVEGQLLYGELYQQTQAKAPRGILLWGPPGTGKTLLAKAVASQARANFISLTGAELMSRWVGEAEQAIRELFTKARQAAPCVVFIDEIDTLAPARGVNLGDAGVSDRVVGQLLSELDGLQASPDVILIGATNRREALDPALLRAGRLDLQLRVDLPNPESRLSILQVHNQNRPLENVDLAGIAQQTEGWNGADLALLSNQAALEAVRRYRGAGGTDPAQLRIQAGDFEQAYQIVSNSKFFNDPENFQ